jgi:HrpA-like RNA helicase
MADTTPPEILRTNLTGLILNLKALGIRNILGFDMMDVPSIDALSHGLETLYALGAIDDKTNLTQLGLDMSSFPAEPRVARMLIESLREECSYEVAAVAGALQVRSLFASPRRGGGSGGISREQQRLDYDAAIGDLVDRSGDHVTFANVISQQEDHRWDREECRERYIDYISVQRVKEIRDQLVNFLKKFGRVKSMDMTTTGSDERTRAILKCVTAGFFFNVARLRNDGRYYTLRGAGNHNHQILVTPSPSGSIFASHGSHAEYIIFSETHDGPRGGIELSGVSGIDPRWLRELAPHYWQ